MNKKSLTIRKELAWPAAVLLCIALGVWADTKIKSNAAKHAAVDSQLVALSAMSAQAKQLQAETSATTAIELTQQHVEQAFGSTAKLFAQGGTAKVQLVAVPASNYLSGIEKLLLQNKAVVTHSKVAINSGAVTGSIEFSVPVAQ